MFSSNLLNPVDDVIVGELLPVPIDDVENCGDDKKKSQKRYENER